MLPSLQVILKNYSTLQNEVDLEGEDYNLQDFEQVCIRSIDVDVNFE